MPRSRLNTSSSPKDCQRCEIGFERDTCDIKVTHQCITVGKVEEFWPRISNFNFTWKKWYFSRRWCFWFLQKLEGKLVLNGFGMYDFFCEKWKLNAALFLLPKNSLPPVDDHLSEDILAEKKMGGGRILWRFDWFLLQYYEKTLVQTNLMTILIRCFL